MKKLVLKKEVVARINNDQMNQLRGGYADTFNICETILHATCTAAQTCEPNVGCEGATNITCGNMDAYTGCTGLDNTRTCNDGGGITQDICGLSHMVSQCDTCFVRCAG